MASEGTRWDEKLRGCGVVETTVSHQMAGKRGLWSKGGRVPGKQGEPLQEPQGGSPM